ncbi:MAG: glycoside hydrolase family 130 protein [Polyangiaceae bacterium]
MIVRRTNIVIRPNAARVLFRPFNQIDEARVLRVFARVSSLRDDEVTLLLERVMHEFRGRHHRLQQFFLFRFEQMRRFMVTDLPLPEDRRMLIGSYFTQEYSVESAALFNPSLVWHPDQSNLPEGSRRFVLSLRATGEGHISSITFRSGVIDVNGEITLDAVTPFVTTPETVPDPAYNKGLFRRTLFELSSFDAFSEGVLVRLGDEFNMKELRAAVRAVELEYRQQSRALAPTTARSILALAEANYEVIYESIHQMSERIIFPNSPTESNGVEDARFVQFHEEDGQTKYFATYTAYDGRVTFPQILETTDFLRFKISTLNGPQVQNKGMALFPRKINGRYAMLSRQDGENIFLMYSEDLHFWLSREILLKPTYGWEFVQLGNCGSPIETEAGWLVLSHGVGPMRKYSIGAFLLDINDPSKVIGRLREPLLSPEHNEREGYVPNVVYSCGGQIHGKDLIIPYAMSDYASTFALVNLEELLTTLKANPVG